MNRPEINEKLNFIFADVFDDYTLTVNRETTTNDIEEWDSLTHLTLIASIEEAFSIEFNMSEISGLKNVGELMELIERHLLNK